MPSDMNVAWMDTHDYQHYIRPHHVVLLATFMLVFLPADGQKLPPRFMLHIHRFLLNEISELSEPKSCRELINDIEHGLNPVPEEARKLSATLLAIPTRLNNPDVMIDFFNDIPPLYSEREDENNIPPFTRRSIFGYFTRRCFVSFSKLSFLGVIKFQENFSAWVAGDHSAGYQQVTKGAFHDPEALIRLTSDYSTFANATSFAEFEKAQATGDLHVAVESLRRFFDQKFSVDPDSAIRQNALLDLVRMHYNWGNFEAAKKLLNEAITVSRTMGDNLTLQHCMSLLRRLTPPSRSRREPLNELQNDVSPLEILRDVSKLIAAAQPLSDSFEKIVQAAALYDISRNTRGGPPEPNDQWAFHAVQAGVWRFAGCERLAVIEEDIVLAFTESGGSDDTRFKTILNRAQAWAREGRHEDALKLLCTPDTWKGLDLSMGQGTHWAAEIWHAMAIITTRRGQLQQFREFLIPRRPSAARLGWTEYLFTSPERTRSGTGIEDYLTRVLQMRHFDQAVVAIDELLKAFWRSEYQGRFRQYRLTMVLLADVGLEFGMTLRCKKILEEVMPQIIVGDDLELRGFACFVQARCIIASSGKNLPSLRDALPYLDTAERDYKILEIPAAVLDVQYLTSVVYHNLGMEKERDDAARRHAATEADRKRLEACEFDATFRDVWRLVGEVGTALSSR